jgi:hypothetical protein
VTKVGVRGKSKHACGGKKENLTGGVEEESAGQPL